MGALYTNIATDMHLWGYTDILETDLEKMEFESNFPQAADYMSIIDEDKNILNYDSL
ncbi:MAG TPA: hypothetical protein VGB50_04500 [Flavobacterium sp.]|jgi:hypothetical protein